MATIESVRVVMAAEGLDDLAHVLVGDHANRTDCLVVTRRDDAWVSFSTDERAAVVDGSVRTYPSESEALEDFLVLLRLKKLLRDLQRERDLERVERDPTSQELGDGEGLDGLRAEVARRGLGDLGGVIGDAVSQIPDAQVIAHQDGRWTTFLRDERGVVLKRTVRLHPDRDAATAVFLDKLQNLAEIARLDAVIERRTRVEPDEASDATDRGPR